MPQQAMVVLSTAANEGDARKLAGILVQGKLAACVNVVPGLRSIYWWDGAVHDEAEVLLICKTDAERLPRLTETLQREHPYDVPEVVALPVAGGSGDYLRWITESLDR